MAVSVDISDMNTEYNAIRVVASLEQIQSTVNSYVWGVSALCAGVLLLLVVTGLYFIRSIVRPIKQINATTKKYAKGDFSVRIQENSSDEIGDHQRHVSEDRPERKDEVRVHLLGVP